MSLRTFDELSDNIISTVRATGDQTTIIQSFINLTGLEIHNYYPWTWLRRKQTFDTVASQESYNLDEEVDRIALIRQRSTPHRLIYLPDPLFYQHVPNPEDIGTGVPYYYRLWEETGFSTNLAAADTVYVVSSSASDGSGFNVRLVGRNSSGEEVVETITLNGTTNVTSANTYAADGLKQVSKSATTTGTISVYRTTGATLLSELAPLDLAPRFKRIGLYPVPSAAVTTYIEYYERYRYLVHATDVPQMDHKWNWVLREGALAKTWEYKQNEAAFAQHQAMYQQGLRMMKAADSQNLDYVPVLQRRPWLLSGKVRRVSDSIDSNFPGYAPPSW